jgi:ribonuclease-3
LARVSTEIGLSAHIRLGKGEIGSGGADKPRIRASAFEALIGAIYLDRGFEAAIKVVDRIFENHIQLPLQDGGIESDFKSRLQEKCQKQHGTVPAYEVVAESGPEHAREYVVKVTIQNNEMGIGQGRTKKQAEQMAAQKALEVWK